MTANVISAGPVGTLGQVTELLASKRYDYVGAPVEYMEDLVAEKVAPAWPRPSEAGVQPIERYLPVKRQMHQVSRQAAPATGQDA